ncbi:MAG: type II CAAX prenyl endopeptidase Rce1 family protein [Actinomycetota bacterium]
MAVAQETLCRGILVTALRGGVGEVGVWFWSSLLIGLLHGGNIVLGHDVGPTLAQVGTSFRYGSVMYGVRRSTGTLVEPIALVVFAVAASRARPSGPRVPRSRRWPRGFQFESPS